MARNLGLARLKTLHQETDTNLVIAHEIEQAKTGTVGQSFQQLRKANIFLRLIHMP